MFWCVTTVQTRKDPIVSQTKDSALPGTEAVCDLYKTKNHFHDSKKCKRCKRKQAKPANQKQSRSSKRFSVVKAEEGGEEHYEVVDKSFIVNQAGDHNKAFANLLLSKYGIPLKS